MVLFQVNGALNGSILASIPLSHIVFNYYNFVGFLNFMLISDRGSFYNFFIYYGPEVMVTIF